MPHTAASGVQGYHHTLKQDHKKTPPMTPTLAITVILYTTITSLAIGITTHIIHQDDLKTLNNHIKELKETNKEIKESILKIEKKLTHSRKPHDLPALSHPPTRR